MDEKARIYKCCHVDCKEKSWLGKGYDWKMCEIVFGVDRKRIITRDTGFVVIQKKVNFCGKHADFYKDIVYALLARLRFFSGTVCGDAFYVNNLGCYITIHDCLRHSPIQVFQMSYASFKEVYLSLPPTITSIFPNWKFTENMNTIRDMKTSVNLSVG